MLTQISEPPRSVSFEEHAALTSTTPSSFAAIPPVLHQQRAVQVAFSPDWESYGDGLPGTLFVTEAALCFVPSDASRPGFSLDYPSITLHAISRDASGPSVYCQLDESAPAAPGQAAPPPTRIVEGREDDGHYHPEDDEDEDTPMREMRILTEEASVEPIFRALSDCASLHPSVFDAVDGFSDDEVPFGDPAGFVPFTGEDGDELSDVGRARLEHLESTIVWPVAEGAAVEDADDDDDAEAAAPDGKAAVNGH